MQSEIVKLERSSTLQWVGAGLMHSVGKPLSIAARSADRLLERRSVDEDVRALARVVRMAADEALDGIGTLRLHAEQPLLDSDRVVPIEEIVTRAVRFAAQLNGGRKVIVRMAADLPAMPRGEEIRRILTSLIDNALLATPREDRSPEVRVYGQRGRVVFEVVDFGEGMDSAVLKRAADAFFTTRRSQGGSGIGLMDAKSTAGRLGGELHLASTLGVGTAATIRIPCPANPAAPSRARCVTADSSGVERRTA